MHNTIEIKHSDFWFKVVGMLQQNWALIDKSPYSKKYIVYFINDASGVFDHINFSSIKSATTALRKNDFRQYSKDPEAQKFIRHPKPPFFEDRHPNGYIYSSGMFWK